MDYLKPDEIGKFNDLVKMLEDVVLQLRVITKRMEIKTANINILNFDDFKAGWEAEISSNSDLVNDEFTSFTAEIKDGKVTKVNSRLLKTGGKNETVGD